MSVEYSMRISRLTIDKLGVKLYDKVSAVIAELIANAYDADATSVTVRAPTGKYLATRNEGKVSDKGYDIEVTDDGIGMTPQQIQNFFLVVGAERRIDNERGDRSSRYHRKVMGRKGVGKLAPFGICKSIEVISAGGEYLNGTGKDPEMKGYLTSHIVLDYEGIMALGDEPDERYRSAVGKLNESYSLEPGTRVILKNFNCRKVPDSRSMERQLARRFGIKSDNWQIQLLDGTKTDPVPVRVGQFEVETMPNTRLTFQSDGTVIGPDGNVDSKCKAGFDQDGEFRSVTGWMAYSKVPYKDELMAGVRVYCRGKIAAQTTVFNQRAGFTGEHNIRSYIVGELHANWLDEKEDLIQTDRRDILWSEEIAAVFQEWGQKNVKYIGTLSRNPLRKAIRQLFFELGDVNNRISEEFPRDEQSDIRKRATEIARCLGQTISRGELEEKAVVRDLVDLSITLAPHVSLNSMMKKAVESADSPLSVLTSFLRLAQLAELSSFGRIAEDRLKVIDRLNCLKDAEGTNEKSLQQLITDAPWLINPEWAPVTENQTFASLRREFEKYYEKKTGDVVLLAEFQESGKRPDFVLFSQENTVQIVEIKKPHHLLSDSEMDRIVKYHNIMKSFLEGNKHESFKKWFQDFHITLICDRLELNGMSRAAFDGYKLARKLTHMSWTDFLSKSKQAHQDFLDEANRQREAISWNEENGRDS